MRWGANRRVFLGGVGGMIALPWLESLAPRKALAASGHAKRLLVFYVPNGIPGAQWIPAETGPSFTLPPALVPIAPIRDRVLVVSGLSNAVAGGEKGPHARGTGSFLTCVRVEEGEDRMQAGVSVDQLAVQALAPPTRFPSLELGLEGGSTVGTCDEPFSCAYQRCIAWASPTAPLPKVTNPRLLFDRMFGGTARSPEAGQVARRRHLEGSVLDAAVSDARELRARVSGRDAQEVDAYLDGIRELELRLLSNDTCQPPEEHDLEVVDVEEHQRVMTELMVLAFRCDLTRFITFMQANSGGDRSFPFIGVRSGHHDVSHHDGSPEKLEMMRAIATWEVAQFADLARRLSVIEEDGGTMLDHSILIFSSELGDGSRHDHVDLPMLIAGSGSGRLSPGRHVRYASPEPVANLYLTVLSALGVPADRFGADGDRVLVDL
jgi:hypothetical protein